MCRDLSTTKVLDNVLYSELQAIAKEEAVVYLNVSRYHLQEEA